MSDEAKFVLELFYEVKNGTKSPEEALKELNDKIAQFEE